ncbi:MAG: glycosyltransferase family 4 protein [Actinobacteria bacterium]|nr:glycosyltransferase family 4 protein [Actinomycetota bacterium]MCL5447225.1 glycosyltransferase family 4 protein [Actinomycetota bacterium]
MAYSRLDQLVHDTVHILLTNDFPPKVGGIQSYLWELWSRMDPDSYAVVTASSHAYASRFDDEQASRGIRIHRLPSKVLYPSATLVREVDRFARHYGAGTVVIDPILPLGLIGPKLSTRYVLVAHGAEAAIPAKLPPLASIMRMCVRRSQGIVCAGNYPMEVIGKLMKDPTTQRCTVPLYNVPPGVDVNRFHPLTGVEKARAREGLGIGPHEQVVLSLSRLVPRKGMDVLIKAAGALRTSFPELRVLVGGEGRDRDRLARIARTSEARVTFLGKVPDDQVATLYGAADVFAMLCRDRWLGLEQEGFGIVFLEAAACGIPQIAGRSGGSHEAVLDGMTGTVVGDPRDVSCTARILRRLLVDINKRDRMGKQARLRAVQSFDYLMLAPMLANALKELDA